MRVLCVEEMKIVAGGYDNPLLPDFLQRNNLANGNKQQQPDNNKVVPNQEIGTSFKAAGENVDYFLDHPGQVIGQLIDAALDSSKGGTSGAYNTGKIGDPSTGGGVTPPTGGTPKSGH